MELEEGCRNFLAPGPGEKLSLLSPKSSTMESIAMFLLIVASLVSKKIGESERGIGKEVLKQPVGVPVSTLETFPNVMEHVAGKKILYVGETHDQFSHHVMELEAIKYLHRSGRRVAIGMEMFQRPFQKALDDYIEGRIDERQFSEGVGILHEMGI